MSEPFSDPVVDKFLMNFSFIVGSVFTAITLFAVYFKAHTVVLTTAFCAGAFLMLAAVSYLTQVRLEEHQRKIDEEKRIEQMTIDEQLDHQINRMKDFLKPTKGEQKVMLKHSIDKITKERNS